jgi:hypothetical protein
MLTEFTGIIYPYKNIRWDTLASKKRGSKRPYDVLPTETITEVKTIHELAFLDQPVLAIGSSLTEDVPDFNEAMEQKLMGLFNPK